MSYRIAISGKGGSGKTTISALIVRYIVQKLGKPVLAVDADPNSTLGEALGLQVRSTISDIREDFAEQKMSLPAGLSKDRYIEYAIHQTILEANGFDLLTMGRPEGPKCYCYVNNLLRGFLKSVSADYPYVVMDNEAGMEHLSRRTTDDVDLFLIVAECNPVGIRTARRIVELTRKLPVSVKRQMLVLNRVPTELEQTQIISRIPEDEMEVACVLPLDPEVQAYWFRGRPLFDLPEKNPVYTILCDFLSRTFNATHS